MIAVEELDLCVVCSINDHLPKHCLDLVMTPYQILLSVFFFLVLLAASCCSGREWPLLCCSCFSNVKVVVNNPVMLLLWPVFLII